MRNEFWEEIWGEKRGAASGLENCGVGREEVSMPEADTEIIT